MLEKVSYTPSNFTTQRISQMRIIPATKLDLSIQDSKSYWNNVIENIEAKVTQVRYPSSVLYPSLPLSSPIKYSVNGDENSDVHSMKSDTQPKNIVRKLVVQVSPPPSSCNKCVSEVTDHNLCQDEHINNLKDCDMGNFELDFLHGKNAKNDIRLNGHNGGSKPDIKKNYFKMYQTYPHNNIPLSQIAQLSKISVYVNEFLSNTKVKIGSTIVPRNFEPPIQSPENNSTINNVSVDLSNDALNDKTGPIKFSKTKNDYRNETNEKPDQGEESVKSLKKYVIYQDKRDSDGEAKHWKLGRKRAPSLGVASAVPSFGKILSSLENSNSMDSSSIKDNSDDNRSKNYPLQPKEFLTVPKQKYTSIAKSKHYSKTPEVKHVNSFNSHSNEPPVSTKLFTIKKKKSGSSLQKSITHVITAVNRLKRSQKMKKKCNHGIHTPIEMEEVSTYTTNSSIRSSQSIQQQLTKTLCRYEENNDVHTSTFTNDKTIKSDYTLVQTLVNTHNSDVKDTSTSTKKNKLAIILNAMQRISALYPRKKSDKCLACLHTLKKKNSEDQTKLLICHIDSSTSSNSQNIIIDDPNIFRENGPSPDSYNISAVKFSNYKKCSNSVTAVFDKNSYNENVVPVSDVYSCATTHGDNIIVGSIPVISSNKKLEQIHDEKGSAFPKPFVLTISLTSERSKTISDQDDSDQAVDDMGVEGKNLVESKSKFLVSCHAPINLTPSFDQLRAISGKKTRSIQSRMASLEKTTDAGSDEESEDNEISTTFGKFYDDNKKRCSFLKTESNWTLSGESINISEKTQTKNEDFLLDNVFGNTSYTQLSKASLILNDIRSQLDISTNVSDYDPSESFRPTPPSIPLSKIIGLSKKFLFLNNNVIETLKKIANEYVKYLTEKRSLNSKSNVSNFDKLEKIIKCLLTLLIDSKFYINLQTTSPHLSFSSKQGYPINSRQLQKVLPVKSYNLIATILDIPQWHPKHWSAIKDARKLKSTPQTVKPLPKIQQFDNSSESDFATDIDLVVHPPSQRESVIFRAPDNPNKKHRLNPYASFITKPKRKAITWRELTQDDLGQYDPQSTLKNRAAQVTDEICSDFCQWLKSLGGFNTTVDEAVLKNMFETDFTAEACKTMQVSIKEMPMVPTAIAESRNCPGVGEVEMMREQIRQDLKAKKETAHLFGFGSTISQYQKFISSKNHVEHNWHRRKNVNEDLEIMDAIWKDITQLESVKGFTKWLKAHPDGSILNY